jgi:hypothetical protein
MDWLAVVHLSNLLTLVIATGVGGLIGAFFSDKARPARKVLRRLVKIAGLLLAGCLFLQALSAESSLISTLVFARLPCAGMSAGSGRGQIESRVHGVFALPPQVQKHDPRQDQPQPRELRLGQMFVEEQACPQKRPHIAERHERVQDGKLALLLRQHEKD